MRRATRSVSAERVAEVVGRHSSAATSGRTKQRGDRRNTGLPLRGGRPLVGTWVHADTHRNPPRRRARSAADARLARGVQLPTEPGCGGSRTGGARAGLLPKHAPSSKLFSLASTARPRARSVDGAVLLAADTRNPTAGRKEDTLSLPLSQPPCAEHEDAPSRRRAPHQRHGTDSGLSLPAPPPSSGSRQLASRTG